MFDISKYDPTELSCIIDPKTKEEMIAIARAIKVIKTQREELKKLPELEKTIRKWRNEAAYYKGMVECLQARRWRM